MSFCIVAVDDGALFVIVPPSVLLIAIMQSWKHFQELLYMARKGRRKRKVCRTAEQSLLELTLKFSYHTVQSRMCSTASLLYADCFYSFFQLIK